MLSKGNLKFVQSLRIKKHRDIHQQFIIEGDKLVTGFLHSDWIVTQLLATSEWLEQQSEWVKKKPEQTIEITHHELNKISAHKTPNQVMAVAKKLDYSMNWKEISSHLTIFLDEIQDPGNFGTILRIASWFGINNVVCSISTVDLYNPKVVQATMGALLKVKVHYVEPVPFLTEFSKSGVPVYGTLPGGKSIYETPLVQKGVIILGNESHGISNELSSFITDEISIPEFGSFGKEIESLNVAVAAGIICSEFRRREN